MRALVTGAAGFIGSHLTESLLDDGWVVVGVDSLTPYYDQSVKRANIARLIGRPGFTFERRDLLEGDLETMVAGCRAVFHLAGQPGVRSSWASGFRNYIEHNILATQRLLEACRTHRVNRFVYASSSSVYGQAPEYPTRETDPVFPHSPYGVTKLAGENLCGLYAANHDVATTMLRYFTVYGPRQRPDMGIHQFISRALNGRPITVFGDGEQIRDFTFVSDVVAATRAAGECTDVPSGTVINVAGGSAVTVNELLELIGTTVGTEIVRREQSARPGDVDITGGSTSRARRLLGWSPAVDLRSGIAAQVDWQRSRQPHYRAASGSEADTAAAV